MGSAAADFGNSARTFLVQVWPLGLTEVLGFATGGICVWLVVREDMLNWPLGLANNLVFFVLFLSARLYADMALQVVYLGLGLYGWWEWLHGGPNKRPLHISRTHRHEWIALAIVIPVALWLMVTILAAFGECRAFLDGLTTILSLAAQFLLCESGWKTGFSGLPLTSSTSLFISADPCH